MWETSFYSTVKIGGTLVRLAAAYEDGKFVFKAENLVEVLGPLGLGEITLPPFLQALNLESLDVSSGGDARVFVCSFRFSPRGDDTTLLLASSKGTNLIGVDLGANFNLSDLPLVGQSFPPGQTIAVNGLQVLVATGSFPQTAVTAVGKFIPKAATRLPVAGVQKGLTVAATMQFGKEEQTLALQVGGGKPENAAQSSDGEASNTPTGGSAGSAQASTDAAPIPATTSAVSPPSGSSSSGDPGNIKWFPLQKAFGPVHFDKLGVQYQEQACGAVLWFLLDASFTAAGLTLSLDGLAFGSPLSKFDPQFALNGLGLSYQRGPLEIGGAFLRTPATPPDGIAYEAYDGAALLETEQLTLAALGSYARLDGHPSLFVYAVLDEPLGGPPFFFVEGLSAGFGYNRSLTIPPVDQVAGFPLVAEAMQGTGGATGGGQNVADVLSAELGTLAPTCPPAIGEDFFAVGVKFTSFKMVDSFALLTAQFGTRFELNVLGLSTVVVPTDGGTASVTPVAEAQIALRAGFLPDEGLLEVNGALTSASYILSKSCHLTGGFAFYSWFSGPHADDFVFTIGGYNPAFHVPAYYPRVPRLAFHWQVDSQVSIKGSSYFALTPHALMAGASLAATWESGDLKAWFTAAADFLIAWQPYHYDARMHVDIGASYTYHLFGTHHITVDVGADLHLWGPEFSGTAEISLSIVGSIRVAFGAGAVAAPKPIEWAKFKTSFLPTDATVCGISIKNGLLKTVQASGAAQSESATQWIVNPKDLVLVTNSVIPSKAAVAGTESGTLKPSTDFGIGSMGVSKEQLTTTHTITITKDGASVEGDFQFTPIKKNVPAGLWGTELTPRVNGTLIPDTLAGFEITPANQPTAGVTLPIPRANLTFETKTVREAFSWEPVHPPKDFIMPAQTGSNAS